MTSEQHAYGWQPAPPDWRDHKFATPFTDPAALPTLVDLRSGDSPIRDQGQLGSCTAFTGEGAFRFEAKKQGLSDFMGSPQFLYYNERVDQGTVSQDSGASIREIGKALSNYGICPESDDPYNVAAFTQKPGVAAYADAEQHKATQYLSVAQDLNTMKGSLAAGFPIMIGFTVYQNFESGITPSTGMVQMPQGSVLGGHANLLMGYDDARQVFISRNSWGTGFGDKGYVYFPYAYLTNSGLASDFWSLRLVSGPTPTPPPAPPAPPVPPSTIPHYVKGIRYDEMSDGSIWTSTFKYDAPA